MEKETKKHYTFRYVVLKILECVRILSCEHLQQGKMGCGREKKESPRDSH